MEGRPPRFDRAVHMSSLLTRIADRQGQPTEALYRLPTTVLERSVRQDGFSASARPKRAPASLPSASNLADYTAVQPPEQPWSRVPAD